MLQVDPSPTGRVKNNNWLLNHFCFLSDGDSIMKSSHCCRLCHASLVDCCLCFSFAACCKMKDDWFWFHAVQVDCCFCALSFFISILSPCLFLFLCDPPMPHCHFLRALTMLCCNTNATFWKIQKQESWPQCNDATFQKLQKVRGEGNAMQHIHLL